MHTTPAPQDVQAAPGYAILHRFRSCVSVIRDGDGAIVLAGPENGIRLPAPTPVLAEAISLLEGDGATADDLREMAGRTGGSDSVATVLYSVQRWAERGLLRATLAAGAAPLLHAEPMVGGWRLAPASVATTAQVRLSRFVQCRRGDDGIVLESPLSTVRGILPGPLGGALLAALARPQTSADLAGVAAALGHSLSSEAAGAFASLLVAARLAGEVDADGRLPEDCDPALVQWEAHDLAFHVRSRRGRHDADTGATYRFAGTIPPLPAIKPPMAGPRLSLPTPKLDVLRRTDPPLAAVVEDRRSVRIYGASPITIGQLGELLYRTARARGVGPEPSDGGPRYQISSRPYPSGGAVYDLELYLAVNRCSGLDAGLYHYEPNEHALTRLAANAGAVSALLRDAEGAAALSEPAQVLLIFASRVQRAAWKYSGTAYALVLKNAGVLCQNVYLAATAMGLGACALGAGNSDLFAEASGLDYLAETSVCEMLLGSLP